MDLSKKDKKVARQLIETGLQKEFSTGLNSFYEILHDWKNGKADNRTAYHSIFKAVWDFDKHIARRYDGITGSKYFPRVGELLYDKIISETDLNDFSEETKQKLISWLELMNKPPEPTESKILQFKISLRFSEPEIWRRFEIEDSMTFFDLHLVIQNVMGWTNSHLYQFKYDKKYFIGNPELIESDNIANDKEVLLSTIFDMEDIKMEYEYDFGDGWIHDLVLENILERNPKRFYPYCSAGELNCPPEDSGGIYGFYEMMKAFTNTKHPEHEDIVEWVGDDYDMSAFDLKAINKSLKNYSSIDNNAM
jgi:hypothetical protein